MRAVLEKFQTPRILTIGIWVISLALAVDVFANLREIFYSDWYRVMQADMPDWLVSVRCVVSIALRIVMLWAIAGVLTFQEPHRKLLLGLCVFNIVTFFVHHRYESFFYISTYLNLNTEDFRQVMMVFGHQIYPGVIARMLDAWLWEVFRGVITIAFFINPKVRRLFQ